MATIRIKVTASVDSNLANIFVPLTQAAARARKKVAEDLAEGASQGFAPYRTAAGGAARTTDSVGMAAKRAAGETAKLGEAARKAGKDTEGIATGAKKTQQALGALAEGAGAKFAQLTHGLKELPAELRVVASEAQRELAKIERMKARTALGLAPTARPTRTQTLLANSAIQLGLGGNPIPALARGLAPHLAGSAGGLAAAALLGPGARLAMGAVDMGVRLAGDMIQGIGVNTDVASMFGQQKDLETSATNLSNSGYMKGDARNGRRVATSELISDAREVGEKTGYDPSQVLGGLSKFTSKTGDLATGRDAIYDLARLSKATGSNLEDMVDAAGDVSNVLGNIPNKGQAIYEVMKQVAGEGKTGAVEIRNLASQMAKVSAGAQMFDGDRGRNIGILGAIAQEARGTGGSASATQAATSVSSFVNVFSKSARLSAFKSFGVDVHGKEGGLRSADDIIVDSLNAAMRGGSKVSKTGKVQSIAGGQDNFSSNIGAMFADTRARSAVKGFEAIYSSTYAETKGKGNDEERMALASAAVREEFKRLTSAVMSEEEVQQSFARAMSTTESKVSVFNTQLAAIAGQIEGDLMPALIDLGPVVLSLANGLGDTIEWLMNKSGKRAVEKDLANENVELAAEDALHAGRMANPNAAPEREYAYGSGPVAEGAGPGPWAAPTPFAIPSALPRKLSELEEARQRALTEAREKFTEHLDQGIALTSPDDKERRDAFRAAKAGDFGGLQKIAAQENDWDLGMGGNKSATALLQEHRHLEDRRDSLGETQNTGEDLRSLLQSGVLSVRIVNPQDIHPPTRTAADADSRQE